MISDFGVVCYSRFYSKRLMWSHYADSHKGMCLVFDIPKEIVYETFVKVEYGEEIPDAYFNIDDMDNWSRLMKIVKTKSNEWKHEEEYRQVYKKKNFYEDYPGRLSEIIFGSKTTRLDINLVINILRNYYSEIIISKMYLSIDSFHLGKMSMTLRKGEKYWIPDIWDGKCVK